jgi:hypothetical protein
MKTSGLCVTPHEKLAIVIAASQLLCKAGVAARAGQNQSRRNYDNYV